jgi:hypothetical protein
VKHLVVLSIALLIPPAETVKGPCHDDVQKFCKNVGKSKVCHGCLPPTAHG